MPTSAEARGKPAFIDDYLAYLLARASERISGQFHEALRQRGVPVMHWRVMAVLHDGPMHVSELGALVLAQQPTVSKLLDRMHRAGLVRRERAQADRRRVRVSLTERGMAAVAPLLALARRHEQAVLAPFGQVQARRLVSALRRLVDDPRPIALPSISRPADTGSPPSTARTDNRTRNRPGGSAPAPGAAARRRAPPSPGRPGSA